MRMYEKLDFLLEQQKMTKKDLAAAIGIPYSTLTSAFGRKSSSISINAVISMARVLSVDIEYLVNDEIDDPAYVGTLRGPDNKILVSSEELSLIKKYREAPPEIKRAVSRIVEE